MIFRRSNIVVFQAFSPIISDEVIVMMNNEIMKINLVPMDTKSYFPYIYTIC